MSNTPSGCSPGSGPTARLVAGGHSLLPMMKLRLAHFEYPIDINELHATSATSGSSRRQIRIGAMTRHRELLGARRARASVCPIFHDAERVIADPLVRNRGTIGGSLCQADPSEDLSGGVHHARRRRCVIRGRAGRAGRSAWRVLPRPVRDGGRRPPSCSPSSACRCGRTARSAYEKVGRRAGDWAVVSCGVAVWLEGGLITDARVGLAAVGPNTTGMPAVSQALRGRPPSEELYAEAGALAAAHCPPVTDQRAASTYKRHLAGELTARALRRAVGPRPGRS